MGLDMYLEGRKYLDSYGGTPLMEDGFEVKEKIVRLGYWRKHPNLHGFIVKEFAGGKDECQDIELGEEEIQKIITAVKKDKLPETSGFFFGQSQGADDQNTIQQLSKALEWLKTKEKGSYRSVVYRASW